MNAHILKYLISQAWAVRPELLNVAMDILTRDGRIDPQAVQDRTGARLDGTETTSIRNGVAIVPVIGPIFRYADFFSMCSDGATVEAIARDFRAALDDPAVSAILLNIDSPGGQANGIAELAAHIRDGANAKPVIAYVGGDGCSAAYWLASAASEITISSTAMLGSIGVVMAYPTPKTDGKAVEFVSSVSPNKRPNPTTEKGRAVIQATVDDLAELFVGAVATYRGVSTEKVLRDFGQGGYLIGQKAVDAGLADSIGTFESTLSRLASGQFPAPRTARVTGKPAPKSTRSASASASASAPHYSPQSKGKDMAKPSWLTRFMGGGIAAAAEADEPIDFEAIGRMQAAATATATGELHPAAAELKTGTISFEGSDAFKAMKAEIDALKAAQSGSIESQAKSFIAQAVTDRRILPASAAATEGTFVAMAKLDATEGGTKHVDGFKAMVTALPQHTLTQEMTASDLPAGAKVIASDSTGKPQDMSADREAELLGMTPLGMAASRK